MNIKITKFFDKLKRRWYLLFYKFYRVQEKSVFFFPHPNCQVDKYDVIRYHSDNALCLVNYLLHENKYRDYRIFVAVYEESNIESYVNYCKELNPEIDITFVGVQDPRIVRMAANCEFYFTDTTDPNAFFKKKSNQTVVDLGYYVPFKNLYLSDRKKRSQVEKQNAIFDYIITTADMPARTLSLSFGVPLDRILTLGLCRNDIFYNYNSWFKEKLVNYFRNRIKKIIVYVPTWRNYEFREGAEKTVFNRSLFGYDDNYSDKINDILESEQAVIIAKLHPLQCNINVTRSIRNNIILYNDIAGELDCSLYQLLSVADGIITDYTTTYWDFLNRDKPVIFNFYDLAKYTETRGFSYNPIEFFCAGQIVSDGDGLLKAIQDILTNKDDYKEDRRKLRSLFDCHCDGNNTKRIADYFFQ